MKGEELRAYLKARYYRNKANGICVSCGKEPVGDNSTGGELVRCETCRSRRREWSRALRKIQKENGICIRCGNADARPNRVMCAPCAERHKEGMYRLWSRRSKTNAKSTV